MEEKKTGADRAKQPLHDADREDDGHQPSWIQKYLDLADLLMRRRRYGSDDDDKAA